MGKHTDALKPLEEFRAPWETEGGEDAEIVKPTLRRWIYNLIKDKAKAQDAREEAQAEIATVEKELETAKAELTKANGDEAQKEIDKLKQKVTDLTAERDGLVKTQEQNELRAEVLGDLDPKYAKYVVGETQEELEKSLEQVKTDFNLEDAEEGEEGEEEIPARTTPRSKLRNPINGKSGTEDKVLDYDKVAADILGSGPFG